MSFSQSLAIRLRVKSVLEERGVNPEVATYIGRFASIVTAAKNSSIVKKIEKGNYDNFLAEYFANKVTVSGDQITSYFIDEYLDEVKRISMIPDNDDSDNTINNSDLIKTEYKIKTQEIFHQIDLVQARISKKHEEIEYLAKETDELLSQLANKES